MTWSGLESVETGEGRAFAIEQFLVGADLGDAAFAHDDNTRGVTNRGKTVCDDEGGAAFDEAIDSLLHKEFGLEIEGAGGFIEDDYAGISQ